MAISKATQTEDDWEEVKADVKQLVNALRSLNPQSKGVESKREFGVGSKRAQELESIIRPTNEKLETLAIALASMFTTFHRENQYFKFSNKEISAVFFPICADKLILKIPKNLVCSEASPTEFWNMSPGNNLSETQASRIRAYFIEHRARTLPYERDHMDENANDWIWKTPDRDGDFKLLNVYSVYNIHNSNNEQTECQAENAEIESLDFDLLLGYGHGHLCLIKAPVRYGVLNIRWVNFVVAQASRLNYLNKCPAHFDRVVYFLGVFAGFWPSRSERSSFAWQNDASRWYLQVHFRYFAVATESIKNKDAGGLQCKRERGKIVSNNLKVALHSFKEKRISVFGLLFDGDNHPTIRPAFYNVLVLGETSFGRLDGYFLKWRPGLHGAIAFQFAVLTSVITWKTEWNKVLDQIDDCLHVRLEQTLSPEEMNALMFDDNFERSRLYFTILQTLRIFGEYISTVSDDLRPLDDLFLKQTDFPMPEMRQDELQALRSNWELVRETQRTAQKNLSDRVLNKTEELKSLRDGLFNASSLREANRSSVMGRYVLIFTVVTVLYLPPSFVSTVFALDIFQKDAAETKWNYKVALVSVSLFTYTIALAFVIAVDWNNFRRRCSLWWAGFSRWRGGSSLGGNTAGNLNDSAADVPASRAPEREVSSPNETTPARKVGDVESGPREPKYRFPRFLRTDKSGESSDPKDKGKAPEKSPGTTPISEVPVLPQRGF